MAGLCVTRVIDMAPVTALHSGLYVPMRKWILIANRGEETKDCGCVVPFLVELWS